MQHTDLLSGDPEDEIDDASMRKRLAESLLEWGRETGHLETPILYIDGDPLASHQTPEDDHPYEVEIRALDNWLRYTLAQNCLPP